MAISSQLDSSFSGSATVHTERSIQFCLGSAFYRSQSRIVRDLGVLAAAVQRSHTGTLRVLETMSGCGVRSLRYGLEAGADWLWANDANPDLQNVLTQNLAQLPGNYCITAHDAHQVLLHCGLDDDRYDLVDIDAFGNPTAYGSAVLGAVKVGGLVYLTATDGRTLAGHDPELCLQRYGAYGRAHPSAQEQGLRILIGWLCQQASARGLGLIPVFSLFTGQTFRVMVRLLPRSANLSQTYGFLGYCHACGAYQVLTWRKLGQSLCPHHPAPRPLTLTGPLWLGSLHDRPTLTAMQALAQTWQWRDCEDLLTLMETEIDLPPYFWGLGELAHRGKMDPPRRDRLLHQLQQEGYHTGLVHWNPQAIRTDASLQTCLEIMKKMTKSPFLW